MNNILKEIKEPIFYVTNDVSRGIGLEEILPNYHIICLDDHPLVDILIKNGVSVFCLERELGKKNDLSRSSGVVLSHPLVLEFIKNKSKGEVSNILFFKPQHKIEIIAKENEFNLIGNSIELNKIFEDKISFFELCQKKEISIPKGEVCILNDKDYDSLSKKYGKTFVVQFGRGWAGNSTYFINTEEELQKVKIIANDIKVKICKYIKGKTVLNNATVFGKDVYHSIPAIQINAHPILTSTMAGTGGRQWPANINEETEEKISEITNEVGKWMVDVGYKGYFGLDFIIEEGSNNVYLSECNARLTASAPFYTKMELSMGNIPLLGLHVLSFLEPTLNVTEIYVSPKIYGSEIVVRNIEKTSVLIEGELKTGLYDKQLKFITEASFLKTEDKNVFWLTAASKERIVNPEIELIKIDSNGQMVDDNGNLKKEYVEIIKLAKDRLKLKNV